MNKIKIDNYYKPESKTLRLDELDYTVIPNSVEENKRLTRKITKALEKIEEYNLGKYDYSIPPIGVIELKEILEGKSK